jgi:hypothetical protein
MFNSSFSPLKMKLALNFPFVTVAALPAKIGANWGSGSSALMNSNTVSLPSIRAKTCFPRVALGNAAAAFSNFVKRAASIIRNGNIRERHTLLDFPRGTMSQESVTDPP